ncbi:MAG: HD family hydrolase [Candidatus Thorarchaeota archaeon]
MKAVKEIIHLVKYSETLKRVNRTGWALVGVNHSQSESVSEHSYGTAILSLLISREMIDCDGIVDQSKVISMALIHDLPEALTSDIPHSVSKSGGDDLARIKKKLERDAISQIAKTKSSFESWILELWDEMEKAKTVESRIVMGADVLDMLIHALALETSGVSPEVLNQFFLSSHERLDLLDIPIISSIFWELYMEHLNNAKKRGIQLDEISRK